MIDTLLKANEKLGNSGLRELTLEEAEMVTLAEIRLVLRLEQLQAD